MTANKIVTQIFLTTLFYSLAQNLNDIFQIVLGWFQSIDQYFQFAEGIIKICSLSFGMYIVVHLSIVIVLSLQISVSIIFLKSFTIISVRY